ncbi:MAG TPA: hypothetical protein VF659_07440 [Pyrinomonadaceae bacterium]|jgi:hypothetical protein
MSDEKRQTRLLPFRLRRAGARRAGGGADGAEDFSADAELTALLREWEAPSPSDASRARLLAGFRATARPAPLWRRALAAQVRVPLPVAACAALALLLSPLAFGARPWGQDAARPSDAAAEPAVRVVEVPVVQERVVTRVVYVEKKERGGARGAAPQADVGRASFPSLAAAGAAPAAKRPEPRAEGEPATPATPAETSAGYFTRVNMEDFQPTGEVKIRVLSRGGVDEK